MGTLEVPVDFTFKNRLSLLFCSIRSNTKDFPKQTSESQLVLALKKSQLGPHVVCYIMAQTFSRNFNLNTGVLDLQYFLNLLYSVHPQILLCGRQDKMDREEFKTLGGLKNRKKMALSCLGIAWFDLSLILLLRTSNFYGICHPWWVCFVPGVVCSHV